MARDFKNIKAWKFADDLAVEVYSVTKSFPKEELYCLTSQLRRAVVSIATNIAEGANRETKKEYLYFLNVASGSTAEVEYLMHLSQRLGYIDNSAYEKLQELRATTAKTLYGLIVSIKKEA